MLVGMWMNREPVTVRPSLSIARAAALLSRRHIRRLLVTDEEPPAGRLLGIVTQHDIDRSFPPDLNPHSIVAGEGGPTRPVREVMARELRSVTPETPIEEAAQVLLAHKIGALPVLHASGVLAGIITESDIFRAFCEVLGAGAPGVRLTVDLSREDEDAVGQVIELARRHRLRIASVLTMLHEERWLAVIRLVGRDCDALIDDVWRSGHRVLSVLRSGMEPRDG